MGFWSKIHREGGRNRESNKEHIKGSQKKWVFQWIWKKESDFDVVNKEAYNLEWGSSGRWVLCRWHLWLEFNASNNNIQWRAIKSERKLLAYPVNGAEHLHFYFCMWIKETRYNMLVSQLSRCWQVNLVIVRQNQTSWSHQFPILMLMLIKRSFCWLQLHTVHIYCTNMRLASVFSSNSQKSNKPISQNKLWNNQLHTDTPSWTMLLWVL